MPKVRKKLRSWAFFGTRSLGIEITDDEVRFVELLLGGDQPRLLAVDSEPVPAGAIDEGRIILDAAVIQAVRTLKERVGTRKKQVHLMLPGTLTMIRFLKMPDVPHKDLRRMIDFELRFNIPLPFDQPYYDFIKLPPSQQIAPDILEPSPPLTGDWNLSTQEAAAGAEPVVPDHQCDVMIAAAPLAAIEQYAEAVRLAGLVPVSVEIKALSLLRAVEVLKLIDPMSTFVMIDVTSTYADVGIYQEGQLRIARNKAIRFPKKSVSASDEGDGDTSWKDFEFQSACQDLASEIERFINFYRYSLNNRDHEIQHLLVSGDVDQMSKLLEYLKQQFPFEIGELKVEQSLDHNMPRLKMTRFITPLGLALRGRNR